MPQVKITSKQGSLIVCEAAEGVINVSVKKHPIAFVRLNALKVGAVAELEYQAAVDPATNEPTGRLMCTEHMKSAIDLVAATKLAAELAIANARIAQSVKMAAMETVDLP